MKCSSEIVACHRLALIQLRSWGVALSSERMFDYIAFRNDLRRLRVASDSASNRFLGGAIIIILNLFVVGCIPMNDTPTQMKRSFA